MTEQSLDGAPREHAEPIETSRPRGARHLYTWTPAVALAVDTVVTATSVYAAAHWRGELTSDVPLMPLTAEVAGPVIILLWLMSLGLTGAYRRAVFVAGPDEFKAVLNAGLLTAGLIGVVSFLTHFDLSRGFFGLVVGTGVLTTLAGRLILRRAVQKVHRLGLSRETVLLVGTTGSVDEVAGVLSRERWLGWDVVGALTTTIPRDPETPNGVPVVGQVDQVPEAVVRHDVGTIVVTPGAHSSATQVRELVWDLEKLDVRVVVAPSLTDISNDRVRMRPIAGMPLIHLDPPTHRDAGRIGKRAFDIAGALGLIALSSPVLIAAAAWIKLHDGGPVFFGQRRIGRHGEDFTCLKLRTMVVDAESRLAGLQEQEEFSEGLFKMERDPRVTRPGGLLRRFSLDELPQLFNVLRGDMSLVGPRPPLPSEVARYDGHTGRRLHVRPGITGLWQVSGRSDLSWDESIRLDLYYVDNWSLLQDLNILVKTVGAVLLSRGAY